MLEGLDRVPWSELTHAYGPATDVPEQLRSLVDEAAAPSKLIEKSKRSNKTLREAVIWELWGNVFHQGTRYPVTPHVVPFLVEILRDGPADAELRAFLLTYLHHLAYGYPADLFPMLIVPSRDTPEDDCEVASYRAVEAAMPEVAPFARDPDDAVALPAIALLGAFNSDVTRAALREAIAIAEPRRKAIALVALAQLDGDTTRELATPLLADADREIAVYAACAVLLATPEIPRAAVDVLVQPLGELTEAPSPLTDSLGVLVSRCLEFLNAEHRSLAVRAMANSLATAEVLTNLAITASLLALVMPERAPATASELTADQRAAVEAIVAHGAFKWNNGDFGNYSSLLRNYKLPNTADALRAWLS